MLPLNLDKHKLRYRAQGMIGCKYMYSTTLMISLDYNLEERH